jgi:hypothetical protein
MGTTPLGARWAPLGYGSTLAAQLIPNGYSGTLGINTTGGSGGLGQVSDMPGITADNSCQGPSKRLRLKWVLNKDDLRRKIEAFWRGNSGQQHKQE